MLIPTNYKISETFSEFSDFGKTLQCGLNRSIRYMISVDVMSISFF